MFDDALTAVLNWEGAYDNDPEDSGGETCYGITRKFEPSWDGWAIVDDLKAAHVAPGLWASQVKLMQSINAYYRGVWDAALLDGLTPALAISVFGAMVNQGQVRAVRWLQESCRDMGKMVYLDGIMGPGTIQAANSLPKDVLLALFQMKRVRAYLDASKGENNKFFRGWISRVIGGA